MGASRWQIIGKVLLREARPASSPRVTITVVALIGYSAMAGVVGGGGLGDFAIRYGYQRFETDVMSAPSCCSSSSSRPIQCSATGCARSLSHR